MQIRIEGTDLPGSSCGPSPDRPEGHHHIHVGVPRRGRPDELLGLTPGDASAATWTLPCTAAPTAEGVDVKGPYIQGRPAGRFIYLSWGTVDDAGTFRLFKRSKLALGEVPVEVLRRAVDTGTLVGRLGLTNDRGNPGQGPIEWTAEAG